MNNPLHVLDFAFFRGIVSQMVYRAHKLDIMARRHEVTPEQRAIHTQMQRDLEHTCREEASQPFACLAVMQSGITGACQNCLTKYLLNNPDLAEEAH